MARRSSSCPTTLMCRVLTLLKASALCIASRATPSWQMLVQRITFVGLSTRLRLEGLLLTAWLCIANVRCLITLMISWCNVKDARTGFILLVWAWPLKKRRNWRISYALIVHQMMMSKGHCTLFRFQLLMRERSSPSAERGDVFVLMHPAVVVPFSCIAAHSSSSVIVVSWNCTVQRDAEHKKARGFSLSTATLLSVYHVCTDYVFTVHLYLVHDYEYSSSVVKNMHHSPLSNLLGCRVCLFVN